MLAMHESLNAQTKGITEVNRSLQEINEATQQSTILVEKVSQTSASIIDRDQDVEEKLQDFKLRDPKKYPQANRFS